MKQLSEVEEHLTVGGLLGWLITLVLVDRVPLTMRVKFFGIDWDSSSHPLIPQDIPETYVRNYALEIVERDPAKE